MPEALLEVLEWNGTALVPLTIMEEGANTLLSTNLNTNPSGDVNTDGYARVTGTGGAATLSRQSGTGADGKAGFIRATWTTASTSGGGINVLPTLAPDTVPVGGVRTIQHRVRTSKACTISFGGYIRAASTAVSAVGQTKFTLAANTWTPVTQVLPAATSAGDNIYLYAYFDGAANAPGVGDFIDLDMGMVQEGSVADPYYDGDTPDTITDKFEWVGLAGQSRSVRRDARGGALQAVIVT